MTLPVISGGIAKGYAIFDEQDNYTYYEAFAEIYKMAEILKQSSDSLYIIGKDQSAVIRSTGAVSEFRGVYIDGMEVSANDYILTEGPATFTFRQPYMDKLKPGKHRMVLSFTAGDVETAITVAEEKKIEITENDDGRKEMQTSPEKVKTNTTQKASVPDTSDHSAITQYILFAMFSGSLFLRILVSNYRSRSLKYLEKTVDMRPSGTFDDWIL